MANFIACTGISGDVLPGSNGRSYVRSFIDLVTSVDDITKRNDWLIDDNTTFDGSEVGKKKVYQVKLWAALLICPPLINHVADMLTLACDPKTHRLAGVAHGCF